MDNYNFKKCSIKNSKVTTMDYYYRKLLIKDMITSKIIDQYIDLIIYETPLNTNDKSRYHWSLNNFIDV